MVKWPGGAGLGMRAPGIGGGGCTNWPGTKEARAGCGAIMGCGYCCCCEGGIGMPDGTREARSCCSRCRAPGGCGGSGGAPLARRATGGKGPALSPKPIGSGGRTGGRDMARWAQAAGAPACEKAALKGVEKKRRGGEAGVWRETAACAALEMVELSGDVRWLGRRSLMRGACGAESSVEQRCGGAPLGWGARQAQGTPRAWHAPDTATAYSRASLRAAVQRALGAVVPPS